MVDIIRNFSSAYAQNVAVKKDDLNKVLVPSEQNQNSGKGVSELPSVTNPGKIRVPMQYKKISQIELPYGIKGDLYKLSNGQKVVILPNEGRTVVKSYVNTGSMNEPDNIRGISHYIEHNLFNGSEGLEAGEFFATTDKMGAETNASTGLAETNYFISSHLLNDEDLEKKIKLHASMLETPRFALDMLEKEKGIVNSEINMITSELENIAYAKTLKTLFGIKTTSEDVIAGTTDNITNLTREDVVNYFNANYYPGNIVTVISGEVEPEETMKLVAKYFSSNRQQPQSRYYENLTPINKTVRKDIISERAVSPYISMGFVGPENNNIRDRVCLEVLDKILFDSSSAIKRFEPYNVNINSFDEKILPKPSAPRALMLMTDVSEENSEKVLKEIYSQISSYQNKGFTEEELVNAKRVIKKYYQQSLDSSFFVNSLVGQAMLEGNADSLKDFTNIIDSLTVQDLQNAVNKYYNLNKAAITVLHTTKVNAEDIKRNYKESMSVPSFSGLRRKQAINMDKVQQYNLDNNHRVVLFDQNSPLVNVVYNMRLSHPVKAKNPAAYSVLNEILNNKSLFKNPEEMLQIKDKYNLDLMISADSRGINAIADFELSDFSKSVDLMQEIIKTPRFTQETFAKAVQDIKDSTLREIKSPKDKLYANIFKDEFHTPEDVLAGLETLTLDDVKNLYKEILENSQGIFAISAPFSKNAGLKEDVFAKVGSFDKVQPYKYSLHENYTPDNKTNVYLDTDNVNQANIIMAYKYKVSGNMKDLISVSLLNTILGGGPSSRLFNELREKQKLAYSVSSRNKNINDTSALCLNIKTTTDNKDTGEQSFDNIQKSIEGFKNQIEKFKSEKVSQEELDSAKLALKNNILTDNEQAADKLFGVVGGLESYYGAEFENKCLDIIDSITAEDIYRAANYIFSSKPQYSIVATKDTLDANKEYLESLKT